MAHFQIKGVQAILDIHVYLPNVIVELMAVMGVGVGRGGWGGGGGWNEAHTPMFYLVFLSILF